jgi:hypothetical protein
MKKYHYVYYSYEEWGRGYIGSRSCSCLPQRDVSYFGSFKDKTYKPKYKIILDAFPTRKEALEAEIVLHKFFNVVENPHFANKARATSSGFCVEGTILSEDHKNKISARLKGIHSERVLSSETRDKISKARKGKKHSDETKLKMSKTRKNKQFSIEHRQKIAESVKKSWVLRSEVDS